MKTIKIGILILFICLSAKNVNAQLQNNTWKGVFMVPDPTECVIEFKSDTVYLRFPSDFNAYGVNFHVNGVNDGNILETMVYKRNMIHSLFKK